jgi:hypothetical protein
VLKKHRIYKYPCENCIVRPCCTKVCDDFQKHIKTTSFEISMSLFERNDELRIQLQTYRKFLNKRFRRISFGRRSY